ncbi:thermonuclease family protein [Allopusillimonas ginsengisoli]|uniref:thermonuclease family protein n=1 Tax=Allopusillimonas ginsengisoli TaxID=453575 RepID=UPI001020F8EA|nr:thermonuclease family protein [Allopusillimonas ginsengisoli]TEA78500.1 nuclease [Allopusillimonas ginsengisoli]
MNANLNALARALAGAVTSRRWGRAGVLVVVLGLSATGALTLLEPQAETNPPAMAAGDSFALHGKVVRVADGDTFTLLVQGKQRRIRMASIDAPEMKKDADRPGQAFADASRKALERLIAGKTLTLTCYEQDRYDRAICDVPLSDGGTANRRQVQAGMAWANMEGGGKFMRDDALRGLEQQARTQGLGLWGQRDPVRPWVWRYQCWRNKQC